MRTYSTEHYQNNKAKYHKRSIALMKKYPEKNQSRIDLRNAVASGKVKRQPCEVCGNPKSQGHHHDYSKPLDVKWLCARHHAEDHSKIFYGVKDLSKLLNNQT